MRERGFTVAVVGMDGAGKTTVSQRLDTALSRPVYRLYMGVNPYSSNTLLPTTRVVSVIRRRRRGGEVIERDRPGEAGQVVGGGLLTTLRSLARLANRVAEEMYRYLLARREVRKGRIVLFDRHFLFDYYTSDIAAPRTLAQRLHGLFLRHVYPRPNLVIYLDAPPEVLLARKGEGTLESLARRRDEYLGFGHLVPHYRVVDGTRSVEDVAREVAGYIEDFATSRTQTP